MDGGSEPTASVTYRFGEVTCSVVSDGPLYLGPARESFPEAPPAEVDAALLTAGWPTDHVVLHQNALIVDDGRNRVLIDTGVGSMPDLGRRLYGPQSGQLVGSMERAGYVPDDIDVVALTHTHPDHAWGLLDAAGHLRFPGARLAVGDADYAHFTDPAMAEGVTDVMLRHQYSGARTHLLPYEHQVTRIGDGSEVVPGLHALATPGHSPGHLVYEVALDDRTLVVWGDLCHHPILLEHPDWSFKYDGDASAAAAQRRRIFERVIDQDALVLSYHFPFPGIGTLERHGDGYAWRPGP